MFRMREEKGFTLIEMLISITILIIGLVGVIMVIPLAQRTSSKSALNSKAVILAGEKLEELKTKGYDVLAGQTDWEGTEDIFTWHATISPVTEDDFNQSTSLPADGLLKIVMDISYNDGGKERTETIRTFYSEL